MENLFRDELQDTIEKFSKNSRSGVSARVLTNFVCASIDCFDDAVTKHNQAADSQLEGTSTGQNRKDNLNRREQGMRNS